LASPRALGECLESIRGLPKGLRDLAGYQLDPLARARAVREGSLQEISAAEDEGDIEEILAASEHAEDACAFDVARLEADVRSDVAPLREVEAEAAGAGKTPQARSARRRTRTRGS
jgi:hypothetical protein